MQQPVTINFTKLIEDFPLLRETIHGKRLVYLDNAATTQKPQAVIDALVNYYQKNNANVHRGVHLLAARAEEAYESARDKVRQFINAKDRSEIIFTRGTTEAINLVAQSYGRGALQQGDKILLSVMEHHSNIVPWQLLRDVKPINLQVIPILVTGDIDLNAYQALLKERPKLVAITHVSNVLGTINPIKEMIKLAHAVGSLVLVDGAQAVAHLKVDVEDLDADFYVFSGHKMYGPTGIGVLYAKRELLEKMPPYQGGGGMIEAVSFDRTTYADVPYKFEAGTPNIAGAIGLGAAIDYLNALGMESIDHYEQQLFASLVHDLEEIESVHIIGNPSQRVAVVSLVVDGVHAHDVGTVLDRDGVAVRVGHHCAMPLMEYFRVPATTRISLGLYNTAYEMQICLQSLAKVKEIFNHG